MYPSLNCRVPQVSLLTTWDLECPIPLAYPSKR